MPTSRFLSIQMGALEPVDELGTGFCNWLFLLEEVTVIKLSTLNGFVTVTKFQMETMASVLGSIGKGDWMFSTYLKDAYFQIPVHPDGSFGTCG